MPLPKETILHLINFIKGLVGTLSGARSVGIPNDTLDGDASANSSFLLFPLLSLALE